MANWSKDKRPARQKYWDRRTLEKRKVRHILANKQRVRDDDKSKWDETDPVMTEKQVIVWWKSRRKFRVPDKFLRQ